MSRISLIIAGFLIIASVKLSAQYAPSSFEFVENKGQWDNSVQFRGQLFSAEFYVQKKGFMVALHNPKELAQAMDAHQNTILASSKGSKKISYKEDLSGRVTDHSISNGSGGGIHSHAYTVEFVGGNENSQIIPEKIQPYYSNYFIGNDSSKWARNVRIFGAVVYKDVYPNIDVRYYSDNDKLKYDLIIHPGGDPSRIVMKYTGVDKLSIKNNELIVKTSVGDIKELYPYSFQSDNIKGRKEIPCKYVVSGNNVRFDLGEYSKNSVLVIDPSLIFSSFTGSTANQYGYTATPGPDGSLFSGGIVFAQGFPVTPGAYQSNYAGGQGKRVPVDIGIMKFSPNGSQRLYATYIGGSGNDFPHSLISDAQGNLVVMGRTTSAGTGAGAYPGTIIGSDKSGSIVVTKLNSTGSGLIGSLIIGGTGVDGLNIKDLQEVGNSGNDRLIRNYGDDSRSEVIMDGAGNIYVAAQTQSQDFPVTSGAFQKSNKGLQDGVVMKINPTCTGLIWASYLGGEKDDGAFVLDISPTTGNLYVGGGTLSNGTFPGIGAGVVGPTFGGGDTDGFIAEISNDGSTLIRSSYLGTSGNDIVYGLKFDKKGFPYVMGVSRGRKWPVISALYPNPGSSQFIAKMDLDLSKFIYSTVFGSGSAKPNMSPVAFLVDRCENVYASGWGGWIGEGNDIYDQVGVAGMPISSDAIKSTTDNKDFYFIVIKKNASQLLYGTYFGQNGGMYGEHVDGGTSRYDQQGVIYQAICANCGGGAKFPTTPGVVGPVSGDPQGCNLAAVKIAFNFAGVAAGPESFVNGVHDSVGCAPFTVTLRDTVRNAVSYIWTFGDGSPDSITTSFEVNHTYNAVGLYTVRLIAIDSNSCNVSDTAYTMIKVGNDRANLKMDIVKQLPCESLSYRFDNLSTFTSKPFNNSSFVWDFGDGTQRVPTGSGSVFHQFASPGTYMVRLVLVDTGYCNSPDSIQFQDGLRVNPLVKAQFETPAVGCAPYDAIFTNTSLAGLSFDWDFGDGSPVDHTTNPVHHYENPGKYTIKLIAYDDGTCNKISDTSMSILVSARPTAEFSYTPVTPVQNKPHIFTNLSTGGVSYTWLFGDGDSVVKKTMDTVLHQYNASGTYNACLITYNEFGCTDTACHPVTADILPLLDVPNAFTPGKFGRNSIVRVEGFGIGKMSWKIYNRFGQKVFETNDRRAGWDGKFKGQLLPVDVYAYTLDVEFTDGKKTRKTGDITLIR